MITSCCCYEKTAPLQLMTTERILSLSLSSHCKRDSAMRTVAKESQQTRVADPDVKLVRWLNIKNGGVLV